MIYKKIIFGTFYGTVWLRWPAILVTTKQTQRIYKEVEMVALNYFSNARFNVARINPFVRRAKQRNLSLVTRRTVPSKAEVSRFADEMLSLFFPTNGQQPHQDLVRYGKIEAQLKHMLDPLAVDTARVTGEISSTLPALRDRLLEDANAALAFDPAADSLEEVIVAYPGFYATAVYRMAHELARLGVPLLPRMLTEYAHGKTGIDIHPAAQIGCAFVIDHGTGIVIGATAKIGNNVKIYHGVTLGALQVDKSLANTKRHPTIEDNVIIYSNATVLGGETVVGHHSIIGGNVWITRSVSPNSRVYYEGKV